MLRSWLLTIAALCVAFGARAQVTIHNYDGQGATSNVNEVGIFDVARNKISASTGSLIQLEPGTYGDVADCTGSSVCFAWYGVQWDCGWRAAQFSSGISPHGPPFCGEAVYTSPDLQKWTYHGVMYDVNATNVDAPGGTISQGCAGLVTAGGGGGASAFCGIPKVRYNPNTGLYVLWDALRSTSSVTSTNYVNVFTCTSAIGGCTQHTQVSFPQAETINDLEPLIDGSNIYFFHTDQHSPTANAYVEQLDSAGTAWVSTLQTFPSIGEGISAFKRGSNYYYLSGSGCNYCSDAVTQYWITATSISTFPTGGQAGANVLSNSTCNAQNFNISTLLGGSVYLMKADRLAGPPGGFAGPWWGHGLSNEFWYPLTFSGTNINPIVGCPGDSGYPGSLPVSVVIPGITPVTPPTFTADQTSEGGSFGSHCDITAPGTSFPQLSRMQTFTPTQTYTGTIEFMVAECNQTCPSLNCFGPDSNLEVAIYNTTGSGTSAVPTGSPIGTYIGNPQSNVTWAQGSPNSVPWVPQAKQITGVTVTGGVTYAIVSWALSGATQGSYTSTYDQTGTNPYPRGFAAHSSNWPSGNTWVVDSNVALKFSAGVGLVPLTGSGNRIRIFR